MFKTKLILLLILIGQAVYSQEHFAYKGVIIDSLTNEGIEGVHIFSTDDNPLSTVSNSDGVFQIYSTKKIEALHFSHLSYQPYTQKINKRNLNISLKPTTQVIEEITITPLSAKDVVLKAIDNLEKNHFIEPVYYDFFTRVTHISKDSTLNLLEEYAGYIYQKENHNSDFQFTKSRLGTFSKYGEEIYKKHSLISMTEMFTDNMGKYKEDFLHKKRHKNYTYQFEDDVALMDRDCYVIRFSTDDDTYYKKGKLYIDQEDFGILKKVLDNSDYKEVTFKRLERKYYLSATHYYKKSKGNNGTIRSTIYNLVEKPNHSEFVAKANLAPQLAKKVVGRFDDKFWIKNNFIPLPNWIKTQIDDSTK